MKTTCVNCGDENAIMTYEENRVYKVQCYCGNYLFSDVSLKSALEYNELVSNIANLEIRKEISIWREAYQVLRTLNSCNNCSIIKQCKVKPKLGETVRYNCFMWTFKD